MLNRAGCFLCNIKISGTKSFITASNPSSSYCYMGAFIYCIKRKSFVFKILGPSRLLNDVLVSNNALSKSSQYRGRTCISVFVYNLVLTN